jgi:uncharacterized membrane protein YhaH (DUF805 family)
MTTKEKMILAFSVLDLILWIGIYIVQVAVLLTSGGYAGGLTLMLACSLVLIFVFVFYIALWFVTARDIKEKGISWANMVLPILLGGIGGIAYYFIHRGKSPKSQKASA